MNLTVGVMNHIELGDDIVRTHRELVTELEKGPDTPLARELMADGAAYEDVLATARRELALAEQGLVLRNTLFGGG